MTKRAPLTLAVLAASAVALATARAQDSEYEALPEPAAPVQSAPVPAPAAEKPAGHPAAAKAAEPKQKSPGEKAAAEKAGAQKKAATANVREKEEELTLGRRMAPSAAIPAFPGDEKAPKTLDFLGNCAGDYERCMQLVRAVGEKLPDTEVCVPAELDFTTVTERVRKWATLRPDIHGQPAPRVIAAALRAIYPCKHLPPARTAAEKGAPRATKTAQ